MEAALHQSLGLTDDEFDEICRRLNRTPNDVELAMYSVMWSEHCSYKSSRIHLGRLPSTGPAVIMGPGENAGVIEATPDLAIAIRMESHNHPSAIEPMQGAATGVGGILRDIFTVGARPIALLDSLWMGPQHDPHNRWVFDGVVQGISSYGNAVGVPTVGGEIHFDPPFGENPLVNVVAIGVAKTSKLVRASASGNGNCVILIGSTTGRDGIGGVSILASSGFDATTQEKRPAVQVGDPFEEKKLIEACLALLDHSLVVGIQDLGGAGITCATSETADNADMGMHIWLDRVHLRETGMTPVEILTSESQERMLAIVRPESLDSVLALCQAFEVTASVIGTVVPPDSDGRFAQTGVLRAYATQGGELIAEIPTASLTSEAPRYDRPQAVPSDWEALRSRSVAVPDTWLDRIPELQALLAYDPRQIYRRYDHMLFLNTIVGPGADAALLQVAAPGIGRSDVAMALSVDGNPRWCAADPLEGSTALVAESFLNIACLGARPAALVDCLNFGNPEHPEVMWQLSASIDGIARIARHLGVPVVGGNVSLYNEANGSDIDPTPTIATIGLRQLPLSPPPEIRRATGTIVLITTGEQPSLSGSLFARTVLKDYSGVFPALDLDRLDILLRFTIDLVCEADSRGISAVHNLGSGGLIAGLWKLSQNGNLSLEIESFTADALVGEHPSRILVATDNPEALIEHAFASSLEASIVASVARQ
ncbi:MAG: phosphoribosylformylglycinamidine synthase subunit PurL [Ferrimicrobium sp.]